MFARRSSQHIVATDMETSAVFIVARARGIAAASLCLASVAGDDFAKLDLRVARVMACEPVPKATKLLRLDLDLGFETRQVLSGIAEHFAPEEVVGRNVVVVANLAPRTMRGMVSQGMILMAEDRDGRLTFAACPDAEPGAPVK